QAVVVALLLAILFGNLDATPQRDNPQKIEHARRSINLMFLLAVSSFWFGCNNAAKEIVKERTIFSRERDFNLRIGSYYASKLLLLCCMSWLQTLMLFLIVRQRCALPGPSLSELGVLLGLALDGVALGLTISAAAA